MSDQQRRDDNINSDFTATTISQQNLSPSAVVESTISDPSPPKNDLNLNTADLVNLVDLNSPRQAGDGEESLGGVVAAAASASQSAIGQSFPVDPLTPTPAGPVQKISTNQQQLQSPSAILIGRDGIGGGGGGGANNSSQLNPSSLTNLLGGAIDDQDIDQDDLVEDVDQSFSPTHRFIQNPIGQSSQPEPQAPPPSYFSLIDNLQTEGGAAAATGASIDNPNNFQQSVGRNTAAVAAIAEDFLVENNPQLLRQGPLIHQPTAAASQPLLPQQITWKPNRKLLQDIVGLGFSEICAEKALFYTGNESADLAVGWILDNPDSQTDQTPLCFEGTIDDSREASRGSLPSSAGSSPGPGPIAYDQWRTTGTLGNYSDEANMLKMVFAVNSSLKMGLGKIAAQVGHATLALYRDVETKRNGPELLMQWIENGETKVVLRADGSEQLAELEHTARTANLPCYLVHDAGRTQIAAGSPTVLSIFGPSAKVDEVTGSLKLL